MFNRLGLGPKSRSFVFQKWELPPCCLTAEIDLIKEPTDDSTIPEIRVHSRTTTVSCNSRKTRSYQPKWWSDYPKACFNQFIPASSTEGKFVKLLKELKGFLGRLSYNRRFIHGLAVITSTFTPLLKKKKKTEHLSTGQMNVRIPF